METKIVTYGGQAVIEGVMMRGRRSIATSVRGADGKIHTEKEILGWNLPFWDRVPLLRGLFVLKSSLFFGMKSIAFSARYAGDTKETMTDRDLWRAVSLALAFSLFLFYILPTVLMEPLSSCLPSLAANIGEGLVRLALLIGYLAGISHMKDIRRVLEYHGAEHKSILCHEKGDPLTIENVRRASRFHPRCGTNFLMVLMLLSLFGFTIFGWSSLWVRIAEHILFLPVLAGLSYEWLRFAANTQSGLASWLNHPGLWLERLTTREPDDREIEVAIEALKTVIEDDESSVMKS